MFFLQLQPLQCVRPCVVIPSTSPLGRTSVTMSRRKVSFRPSVETLRPPYEDEYSVMHQFCRHIARCRLCIIPRSSRFLLCHRGYGYAKDVYQYLYLKDGTVYSEVSRRNSQHEVRVEVPQDSLIYRLLCQRLPSPNHTKHVMNPRPKSTAEGSSRGVKVDAASRAYRMRPVDDPCSSDFLTVHATIPSIVIPLRIMRVDVSDIYGYGVEKHKDRRYV